MVHLYIVYMAKTTRSDMPDQELLKEIKRVVELTTRVDERIKVIAESHERMADRFDKFLDQHAELTSRVIKLESSSEHIAIMDKKITSVEEDQQKLVNRVVTVEATTPYALKIVDQSLAALNQLANRVSKVESDQNTTGNTMTSWHKWINWAGDWSFKMAWIIIAAYILARIGLGGVNIPAPF